MIFWYTHTFNDQFGTALRTSALVLGTTKIAAGVLRKDLRYGQPHPAVAVRYLEVRSGAQRSSLAEPANRGLRPASDATLKRDPGAFLSGDVA